MIHTVRLIERRLDGRSLRYAGWFALASLSLLLVGVGVAFLP